MSCPKLSNWFHLSTSITFGVSIAWDLKNLYLLTRYLPFLMLIIILRIFSSTQESNLLCPKFFPLTKYCLQIHDALSILLEQSHLLGYDYVQHSFILFYLYTSYKRNPLWCIIEIFLVYFLVSMSIWQNGPFRIMVADLLGCVLATDINGKYYVLPLDFPRATSTVLSNINPN